MSLIFLISHSHLPKLLLLATFCSIDIVVIWTSKTQRQLPEVYANILERLWFVYF